MLIVSVQAITPGIFFPLDATVMTADLSVNIIVFSFAVFHKHIDFIWEGTQVYFATDFSILIFNFFFIRPERVDSPVHSPVWEELYTDSAEKQAELVSCCMCMSAYVVVVLSVHVVDTSVMWCHGGDSYQQASPTCKIFFATVVSEVIEGNIYLSNRQFSLSPRNTSSYPVALTLTVVAHTTDMPTLRAHG